MNLMNIIDYINAGVVVIGLPVLVKTALTMGKELQRLHNIEDVMRHRIEPAIQNMSDKISELDKRVAVLESRDIISNNPDN